MRKLLPVILLSLMFGACKSADAGSGEATIVNKTCPIMSDHAVDANAETVEYGGYAIGFCCDGCVDDFNAWPEAKKDEYLQQAVAAMGMATSQPSK